MDILRGITGLIAYALDLDPASPEATAERRAICQACPYRDGKRCSQCGCYIQPKTSLRTEICPRNRWL